MSEAAFIVGDVRRAIASLPDGSIDLVLTSPPFLALRSYLPADHPDKAQEIGSEPTPGAFIDRLLEVIEDLAPKVATHGSICIELGDTYSGSGGAGDDYVPAFREGYVRNDRANRPPQDSPKSYGNGGPRLPRVGRLAQYDDGRGNPDGMRDATFSGANTRTGGGDGWPQAKSLCLVPELFRVALVYGFNPLTGRQTPRWRARNVVRWCRPNPPVGALGDKVRPATSDLVIACKGTRRYFDLDAVRGPSSPNTHARTAKGVELRATTGKSADDERRGGNYSTLNTEHRSVNGAPPLDHWWADDTFDQDAWLIPSEPYKGAHYATWPTALLTRPILAMCPERVCTVCGKPSERITTVAYETNRSTNGPQSIERRWVDGGSAGFDVRAGRQSTTTGWTDCGHDSWRRGMVLDPFAGSGTTLAVATGHARDAIGIDIDARNADLAVQRVGMFLTVTALDKEEIA